MAVAASRLTRCSGHNLVTHMKKGLAAITANPSSLRWLRGSDLNRRPLGYEPLENGLPRRHRAFSAWLGGFLPWANPWRARQPKRLLDGSPVPNHYLL